MIWTQNEKHHNIWKGINTPSFYYDYEWEKEKWMEYYFFDPIYKRFAFSITLQHYFVCWIYNYICSLNFNFFMLKTDEQFENISKFFQELEATFYVTKWYFKIHRVSKSATKYIWRSISTHYWIADPYEIQCFNVEKINIRR